MGFPNKIGPLFTVSQRTPDTFATPVQHMRVNHRRVDVLMAQQFLNRPDVVAIFKQMRGKRMAQRVPNVGKALNM